MINEQIRDKEVRLIGEDGEQLGIVSSRDALKMAEEAGLDLVDVYKRQVPETVLRRSVPTTSRRVVSPTIVLV